jgi:hypothetical protein
LSFGHLIQAGAFGRDTGAVSSVVSGWGAGGGGASVDG